MTDIYIKNQIQIYIYKKKLIPFPIRPQTQMLVDENLENRGDDDLQIGTNLSSNIYSRAHPYCEGKLQVVGPFLWTIAI